MLSRSNMDVLLKKHRKESKGIYGKIKTLWPEIC